MPPRDATADASGLPSAATATAPNPPPTPEERPDPTTGSGRTAFLVPTFLGNNVARGADGSVDGAASDGSSSKVWPRRPGTDSIGRGTPTPRTPEPAGKRATSGMRTSDRSLRPRPGSRLSRTSGRTSARTSARRSATPTGGGGSGANTRTLMLLGAGVVALAAAVGLGLFLLPGDEPEETPGDGNDRTGGAHINGDGGSAHNGEVTFDWPDGQFPAYTNELQVRRTLRVVAPTAIREVLINGESLRRGRLSLPGFTAQLLNADGEPFDERLSHEEFLLSMEVREGQEESRFEIQLDHAGGAYSTSFESRIDTEPPRVRFTHPQEVHRVRTEQPSDDDTPAPFLLNETDVDVRIRVHDIAIESVSVRLWNDREIAVPVENTGEVNVEERLRFPGDGEYRVRIEALDQAGNETTLEQDFIIDTRPPSIYITSSDDGSPVFTVSESEVTVRGIIEDDSGVRSFYLGSVQAARAIRGERGDRQRRFELDLRLSIGVNRFSISADDMAGNMETVTLVITRTDPDLPKLAELRLDGRSVWREGRELSIRLDEEIPDPVELEIAVVDLDEPIVRIDGRRAELDPERTANTPQSEFIFRRMVSLHDGMQLDITVDGRERMREFAFEVRGVTPDPVRAVRNTEGFSVDRFHPPPHEPFRRAAAFDFDAERGRVVTVTRESLPELLVYDRSGQLVSQSSVDDLHGASPDRVVWLSERRVAISTQEGEVRFFSTSGHSSSNALEIEPGSDWHVDETTGLVALQSTSGNLFMVDSRVAGRAFSLPMSGRADGPVRIIGDGRYVVVGREGTLTVWSIPLRRVVATLDVDARQLMADPYQRGAWYAVLAGGQVARFTGFTSAEPTERLQLPGEVHSLVVFDEHRLIAQTGHDVTAEFHLLARDLSEAESFPASTLQTPRPLADAEHVRFWGLVEGYVVRIRLGDDH